MEMTTGHKGAIAEAHITARAIELGIFVLRPVLEGLRYDLLFDVDGRLLRIQCKWGRFQDDVIAVRTSTSRHTPAGYVRTTYSANEIDAVAVYCHELHRCYLLPIKEVAGLSYVYLRLNPTRNNQQRLIRLAADYDLANMVRDPGAIAQLGERLAGSQKVVGSSPTSSI